MGKYYAKVVGRGKPLIFLPAAGFSGLEGLNIAESLAEEFECHLLDLPGMGKSEGINGRVSKKTIAYWLKEYIDHNDLEKVTLVGHSMGGAIALCLSSLYPEYVSKLVLLDQGHIKIPRFPTQDFGPFGYLIPLISGMERMFGKAFIKRIEKFFIASEPTTVDKEKQFTDFCERFKLEKSDYIKKALEDEAPFTADGLRFMFGYYRLDLHNMLKNLSIPTKLLYASFKDIDEKRENMVGRAIKSINNNLVTVKKIDSHHYVHWAGQSCIDEIITFVTRPRIAIS